MSAPLPDASATTSASGYEDGFGRRALAFDHEQGVLYERLYLRPAFTIYEQALRQVFTRLSSLSDNRIVVPHAIERDGDWGGIVAVSRFVGGERLIDVLDAAPARARDDEAVPGIDVALGFILEVLSAVRVFRAAAGMPHGAIAAARCVFTPDGRVVLTECGFAAVLERLRASRERLWTEFRVAAPPAAGAPRFDETNDVSQAAVLAVMLTVGRPMGNGDPVDLIPEWLAEVVEIAQIRGSMSFAVNVQRFLQRALPLPGRRPYQTIDAALDDVQQLAGAIGGADLCRSALAAFVQRTTGTAVAPAESSTNQAEPRARPAIPSIPPPFAEEPHATLLPPLDPFVPAAEPLVAPPIDEWPLDAAPLAASPLEATQVEDAPDEPEPIEAAPIEAPRAVRLETEPAAADVAPSPVEQPPASRRRRWRLRRGGDTDSLRSTIAPPVKAEPVPESMPERVPASSSVDSLPEPEVMPPVREPVAVAEARPPEPAPALVPPAPIAPPPAPPLVAHPYANEPLVAQSLAPSPVVPQPAFTPKPPDPIVPQPVFAPAQPEPTVPQPVFAPLAAPTAERLWAPVAPAVQDAPAAASRVQTVTIAPVAVATIRLKNEPPPARVRAPRYEPREFPEEYEHRRPAAPPPRVIRVSWKFAAAAAAVMITVVAAGRAYLPEATSSNEAAAAAAKPVTVAAPPPVTTGTIVVQTQPSGARVLLDGSPAGETPLRIVDVAPGRHVLTFITPSASIKRTIRVEANKTLTVDVPVFSGWVAIFAPIVLEISEEGRALGTTDQGRLLLPPGHHTLTLTNRDYGYSADHAVEVEAGEVRSLNVQPTGTVNLNAVPWAEVWIDGKKAGETPIANLQLPLGSREIIFRHPEFGERKMMTRITAGAPVAVTADFSK